MKLIGLKRVLNVCVRFKVEYSSEFKVSFYLCAAVYMIIEFT